MTPTPPERSLVPRWLLFLAVAGLVFGLGLLGSSIAQRRAESTLARARFLQPLAEGEADPRKWGVSFPREFMTWASSREAGRLAGEGSRDRLAERPRLVVLWAGDPYARGWSRPRGHFHSIEDVARSPRVGARTPASCWTCKSSDVPRLVARDGVAKFYTGRFDRYRSQVTNPVACLDCHEARTMALRISRPALVEALEARGVDPARASHQELRSLVCAQCHAEYFLEDQGAGKPAFPWRDGLTPEAFEKFYAREGRSDWTHAVSGARMVKIQHPDYELYRAGLHAFRGVACADCHMPYLAEGGVKFSDHSMGSPLANPQAACLVCHRWTEEEVRSKVRGIQATTRQALDRAEEVLVAAHLEIGDAARRGASAADLEGVRRQVSRAQMYWDYVESSNGLGFHAPQEALRILGRALDLAQECRLETRGIRARLGEARALAPPDLSTREKAEALVRSYAPAGAPAP